MAKKSRKEDVPEGFPERLRSLRVQKNLSQEELGELVDLHYTNIGRYERGLSNPSAEKLKAMAEALGVTGDYLYNGSDENYTKVSFEDRELLRMFKEIEKYSEEEKRIVKDLLDAYITRRKVREMAGKAS